MTPYCHCCSSLAAKTLSTQSPIWRRRFKDLYDVPRHYSSNEIKIKYQIRAIVLSRPINFQYGQKEKQTFWLEVMRDMLLESNEKTISKNLERIRCLLLGSVFLSRPVSGYGQKEADRPSDLFCAIQLCLTDLALDPLMSVRCLRTDYDIGAVYTYGVETRPVVNSNKLDLEKILHIRNFWLRHLLNPGEATFCASYSSLPSSYKPTPWGKVAPVEASAPWLGYDSCIHPYPVSLGKLENRQTCADLDGHWTQVGFMSLQIKPDPNPLNWPPLFETIIPVDYSNSQRSYFRGVRKSSGSIDERLCSVRGFYEPIPIPQGGFPGWCRICFAVYERDPNDLPPAATYDTTEPATDEYAWLFQEGWPPSDLEAEFYWIRGYEGVVLPGGRIMLGSWVDMINTADRGPFIFWKP
ncbi:hypothetical protein ASPCADRAFT_513362 [Aspergillus carbonarius ITEM 5010]|uniref:Uncharacterized protein n=1 Tax=Aspergillus carbonarius (strain ITEM 5010) TaxID=602072 RepID=A0A1R3RT54_ASPC5|nr:hypothetical protein ASPCADRAFT_513362 [Aspergillus carbonarius ITEM 5010]